MAVPALTQDVIEQTTPTVTGSIVDATGAAIGAASLTTLKLTLVSRDNQNKIVNSRDDQNILNANNVTVDSSGVMIWSVQVTDTRGTGVHRAIFEWTYSAGAKTGRYVLDLRLLNTRI